MSLFSDSPRSKNLVDVITYSYDHVTKTLDLSDGRLQSVVNPNKRNGGITLETLLMYIAMADINTTDIRYLDVSKCKLIDEDIILLSDLVIQCMGCVEGVNLSENWIGCTIGTMVSERSRKNPVIKAIRRMLHWGIIVNVGYTDLETVDFIKLFELDEIRLMIVSQKQGPILVRALGADPPLNLGRTSLKTTQPSVPAAQYHA